MTKRELLEVALKVIGVYIVTVCCDTIFYVMKSIYYFYSEDYIGDFIILILNISRLVLFGTVSFILLNKTNIISKKLIGNGEGVFLLNLAKKDLLVISLLILGLYIIYFSIDELILVYSNAIISLDKWEASELRHLTALTIPWLKVILGVCLTIVPQKMIKIEKKVPNTLS